MASVAQGFEAVVFSLCAHFYPDFQDDTRLKDVYFLLPETNTTCVSVRGECLSEREDE